jgi:hypothetical protein
MRTTLTVLLILAGIAGAQAQQVPPGYSPAAYGHDAASQRLALQYAANNAMAAQARAALRTARIEYGRPQRQMR